jgi:hypothetical protein
MGESTSERDGRSSDWVQADWYHLIMIGLFDNGLFRATGICQNGRCISRTIGIYIQFEK